MSKVLGIDLGTTNTVWAVVEPGGVRVLDNKEGKESTPSVVSWRKKKGDILVGDLALTNWPMAPKDTITSIKRLMGRGFADKEVQVVKKSSPYEVVKPDDGTEDSVRVVMGGKQYSPVDISAMILEKVKQDAEYRLGEKEEVSGAVITVPAYFSQAQKAATRLAGQRVGLRVIKVLDEPTAAAIAYGVDSGESTDPKYIMVYDLGGGTFDISVLMWAGNVFAPLTLQGDMWLGGDNFDQVIADHIVRHIKREYDIDPQSNLRFMAMLRQEARAAKERLSSTNETEIILAGGLSDESGDIIDIEMEITRSEFEEMIRGKVEDTITKAKTALADAEISIDQLAHVLMAGNSTCVPLVQQMVESTFGAERVQRKMHPKRCVAMGAARVAAVLWDKIVCQAPDPADKTRECGHVNTQDATTCEKCGALLGASEGEDGVSGDLIAPGGIAPFSYGIQAAGDVYWVFIKKNEPYPTGEEDRQPQVFYTRVPNQRILTIPVYGGDEMDKASMNDKQGEAVAILPARLPAQTPVRLRLWLDTDGVFALTAHLADGTDLEPWVMKGDGDQKAIELLQRVEQNLEEAENRLSPEELKELEDARNHAFDDVRNGKFDRAMERANEFKGKLSKPPSDPLRQKTENLMAFAQFVLNRYAWAIGDVTKQYQLTQLIEETRQALDSGQEEVLAEKAAALQKATDNLPQVVKLFLNWFMAIQARIRPADPALATSLMEELEELEAAAKDNNPEVRSKITQFAAKLADAMKAVGEGADTTKKPLECSNCGTIIPADAVKCPKCQLPRYVPEIGIAKSSGII